MRAESEGRHADARSLFTQAWEAAQDDYDACVAAHFLARHQDDPQDTLYWNQEALTRAALAGGERVRGFYPSLYLNLGYSHELLGNRSEARRYYELAAARLEDLPAGRYGDVVRHGIAEGRKRTRESQRTQTHD
jgi:hypothetical protein